MTEPVRRLVTMADGIAAGRRDVRAEPSGGGELAALATSLNEMTARLKSYEAELADRSRLAALGELSARIAHEIRNPLTGLKLHLQLLAEGASDAQAATVARLLDEVGRLELIVASSLALGGGQRNAPQPGNLVALVDEVLHLMEPSLRHRHIDVMRRLTHLPPVTMDRDRLKQALLNLIANAADALPGGGTIAVTAALDDACRKLRVSVEDSGAGFPPEQLAGSANGSGSRKPFRPRPRPAPLPRDRHRARWPPRARRQRHARRRTRDDRVADRYNYLMARILVADDEPSICSAFEAVLSAEGHVTRTAPNGRDALRLFKEQRPDLVFLDVRMPGMDGIDVLREMPPSIRRCRSSS